MNNSPGRTPPRAVLGRYHYIEAARRREHRASLAQSLQTGVDVCVWDPGELSRLRRGDPIATICDERVREIGYRRHVLYSNVKRSLVQYADRAIYISKEGG
jgi:hypothetical protein